MSWKEVKLVFDVAPVRETALLVMLALAEWSQDDGVSWHPLEDIAKRARCSVRRAREVLQGLAAPDGEGRTLLAIRRAKRTTFYQINLDLLERLDRETNGGQIHLWKNASEPVEEPVDDGGNPEAETAKARTESATARTKSASARTVSINQKNQKEPKEPENQKAAETVVETEGVVVIVKKLSAASAFPPSPAPLSEARLAERRRFLDAQIGDLKKRGLM